MKNRTTVAVHVFLDGKEFAPSSLDKLVISSKTVDRIINDVVDRVNFNKDNMPTNTKP